MANVSAPPARQLVEEVDEDEDQDVPPVRSFFGFQPMRSGHACMLLHAPSPGPVAVGDGGLFLLLMMMMSLNIQ